MITKSAFETIDNVEQVARKAFEAYRQSAKTGDWSHFFSYFTEDFTYRVPIPGEYNGQQNRERTQQFFESMGQQLKLETVEPIIVATSGNTAIVEYDEAGTFAGKPFQNHVVVAYEVRGEKICAAREYLGDVSSLMS